MASKVIVVAGPTATGKTTLAVSIAKKIKGVIINADSVQVYKHLDIGSNKGNLTYMRTQQIEDFRYDVFDIENSGVKGYMFNVVNLDEDFDIFQYKNLVYNLFKNLFKQNITPILVGGSGLYIDAVMKDYQLDTSVVDFEFRDKLQNYSVQELQDYLKTIDNTLYSSLNNSDRNNPRRLIRRIQRCMSNAKCNGNGSSFSLENQIEYVFLYPEFERETLLKKIDDRVDQMIECGFVSEVKSILNLGYDPNLKALQSTGYKQIIKFLSGFYESFSNCVEDIKISHRKYAKRQITWFEAEKRNYNLSRIDFRNVEEILSSIK